MEKENKQAKAVGLPHDALGVINDIPNERYKYIPQKIQSASSAIFEAIDIIANDLVGKE